MTRAELEQLKAGGAEWLWVNEPALKQGAIHGAAGEKTLHDVSDLMQHAPSPTQAAKIVDEGHILPPGGHGEMSEYAISAGREFANIATTMLGGMVVASGVRDIVQAAKGEQEQGSSRWAQTVKGGVKTLAGAAAIYVAMTSGHGHSR